MCDELELDAQQTQKTPTGSANTVDAYRRLLGLQRLPWHKDLRNANNHLMSKNKFKRHVHSLARAKISHILFYWVACVL